MPFLPRLCLVLPLLLALWHVPSHAKLRFGEVERLRHVADTPLTDASGARLYLARKVVEKHFLMPYALEDRGYVLGVSGDSRGYYPLPTGETLAQLQRSGQLPAQLPPYEVDAVDLLVGHMLWWVLGGFGLYALAHRALGRRRAARRRALAGPGFVDTPLVDPAAAPAPAAPLPPLPVTLPLRLQPRRWHQAARLAGALVFVALGALMFREHPLMGALCMGFFGLCAAVVVAQLATGASSLVLDAEGFTVRHLLGPRRVRWRDVTALRVVKTPGQSLVGWDYAPSYDGHASHHKVSRWVAGFHAALPDSYGMKPLALAELMDLIRRHHLRQHHTPA